MAASSSRGRHHCNLTSSSSSHTPILTKLMTLRQEIEEGRVKMQSQLRQKELANIVLKTRLQSVTKQMAKLTTKCDNKDVVIKNKSETILFLEKRLQEKVLENRMLKQENLQVSKENKKLLTDLNVCKVCYESQTAAVFMPCRHYGLCITCSLACSVCPFCRSKISGRIFTFTC